MDPGAKIRKAHRVTVCCTPSPSFVHIVHLPPPLTLATGAIARTIRRICTTYVRVLRPTCHTIQYQVTGLGRFSTSPRPWPATQGRNDEAFHNSCRYVSILFLIPISLPPALLLSQPVVLAHPPPPPPTPGASCFQPRGSLPRVSGQAVRAFSSATENGPFQPPTQLAATLSFKICFAPLPSTADTVMILDQY